MNNIHESMTDQGLVRTQDDKIIAGVCSGLGRRFGLGPWAARIVFVLVLMLVPGSQILIYPLLWVLMPKERTHAAWSHATSTVAPSAQA